MHTSTLTAAFSRAALVFSLTSDNVYVRARMQPPAENFCEGKRGRLRPVGGVSWRAISYCVFTQTVRMAKFQLAAGIMWADGAPILRPTCGIANV